MQHRMKEFTMTDESINGLLERSKVARISTNGQDGYPYTVAIHYVYDEGKIWFHGLRVGEKLDNIAKDPRVCVELDEYISVMEDVDCPCDADAVYQSVVIRGQAEVCEDMAKKREILEKITAKYAPSLIGHDMPEARVMGTAVVAVTIDNITGKYHE